MSAKDSSPRLVLRLLGEFTLEQSGRRCELSYERGRALLAYIAAEPGQEHSRASLAAMFWPELDRGAALANLRLVLHDLRRSLGRANPEISPLRVDRASIRLDAAAGLEIDAVEFSAPTTSAECSGTPGAARCGTCLSQMEILAAGYRGEFMAGFSLPNCPDFEEWLQVQRQAFHIRALGRLARLTDCHERMGALGKSLPFASKSLELEPWNEEALRRTMRLLALNGQRAAALARYEVCCRELKRELGVPPSGETRALAERIRREELTIERPRAKDALPEVILPAPGPERRQVTVLYCELVPVGAENLDDALALMRGPQARCREIVGNYSGYPAQVHGAGLLAYFGYPKASENAARLAVQAALAMSHIGFTGIKVRVGVHTGLVVSGGDAQLPDIVGITTGVAMHLHQSSDHGEVVISGATQRLVAGYFECRSLGVRQLPGIERALEAFWIDRGIDARYRREAAAKLTPLLGRQEELAILLAAWQDVRRGAQRTVLLRGDAGIGKSRLVLALKDALHGQTHVARELRCFPEFSQSPLHPLAAWFGSVLAFAPDDSAEARLRKLAAYVDAHYARADRDVVPLLARMLSLPLRSPYQAPVSSPRQQRDQTLAILRNRLCAPPTRQPILLVVEDLHWADPSTLEFLQLLFTRRHSGPMLAIFTARPEFRPPWRESAAKTLDLGPLSDVQTAALIGSVVPEIAPAVVRRLVERADGVPLFAEELAREAHADDGSAIPPTLQDLLAARLDGLGDAKIAAQLAATIGREFSFDLLSTVSRLDGAALAQQLRRLQEAGIVGGGPEFHFRHALSREAAYQSQTRTEREAAHRRIAVGLKESASDIRPELMAQHWAAGGRIPEAIACWTEAGKLASQHSASQEAVSHFKSGLALIEALPADPGRERLELDLQIGLGTAACAAQGYASRDGAAAYARAIELCRRYESGPEMFPAVWGLWASASSRVGYAHALALAWQLLRMAGKSADPLHQQQAHFAIADTRYWQGEFTSARRHLERIGALYQTGHHERHVAVFGEDAAVTGGAYLSWVLWFLGFPDQARKASTQAVALARQLEHPFGLAYALTFAAILRCRLRRSGEALVLAEEARCLASRHGFPLWEVGATLSRGWALGMQNQGEGVALMQQCVETTRAAMGGVTLVVLEPMAEACVALGLFETALGAIGEAFKVGESIGDKHVESELHRLKGESLLGLAQGGEAQAEACFSKALVVSRQQAAKSLELRAATSMARLWQRQGRREDAQSLLETVYRWFGEGFDLPDLQDARRLLDALASTGHC